jgi:echinoderm microtubule-associated protein-like 6
MGDGDQAMAIKPFKG